MTPILFLSATTCPSTREETAALTCNAFAAADLGNDADLRPGSASLEISESRFEGKEGDFCSFLTRVFLIGWSTTWSVRGAALLFGRGLILKFWKLMDFWIGFDFCQMMVYHDEVQNIATRTRERTSKTALQLASPGRENSIDEILKPKKHSTRQASRAKPLKDNNTHIVLADITNAYLNSTSAHVIKF